MQIKTENVDVRVNRRWAIHDVSMHADPGETVALVGSSGSGKTTLLNVLGLLQRVSSGRVLVGGADATGWNDARRRRHWHHHAAFIFQDYGLIEEENIGYNVALARNSVFKLNRKTRAQVEEILGHVDLAGRITERVSTLSGGEKQRVGFARAIMKSADVLLADEPTASLDAGNRAIVNTLLKREAQRGATVIIATHDLDLAANCTRTVELADGAHAVSRPAPSTPA